VSGFEDITNRPDFAGVVMGRMDGDGIAMGNEFVAAVAPTDSHLEALLENQRLKGEMESQYNEIKRLRVELQSLKDANDCLQDERDALQREVDRLRHQTGEARQQPANSDVERLIAENNALRCEVQGRDRLLIQHLNTIDDLRKQPGESDKLRADVRRLDAQLNAAGETIAQLRQEQARLQARCRELEGWSEDIRLLRKAVRTLAKLR
jgi:predicted nuclease with TOPRIM domain